jgi:hypothetical protein
MVRGGGYEKKSLEPAAPGDLSRGGAGFFVSWLTADTLNFSLVRFAIFDPPSLILGVCLVAAKLAVFLW